MGNLGTHGDEVKPGDYFDLLDVYEDALPEIYEQKTANPKAKKKALSSRSTSLRLRGSSGARDEFLLAATAQNLRKLAKLRPIATLALARRGVSRFRIRRRQTIHRKTGSPIRADSGQIAD